MKSLAALPLAAVIELSPGAAVTSSPQGGPPRTRWPIGLVSRHVQWTDVDTALEVARACGFEAIEWNVRAGAHVLPERVEKDLPRVVEATRKAGLGVTMITTSIQDAASPHAEAIIATAAGLGIRVYRGGQYFRYDYAKDVKAQLEALKPRVAGLQKLNQKYGSAVAYHTHSSRGIIGGNIWDFWTVIRDFDPKLIGLNYDIGHATARGGFGWIDGALLVGDRMRAIAIKDFLWTKGHEDVDAPLRANEPPEARTGWGVEWVPLGQGMVAFPQFFALLRRISFDGPLNLHFEHNNLLGTDVGTWKLHITREQFIEIVKRDVDFIRKTMNAAG